MSTLVFPNSIFLLLSILKKRVIHPCIKLMKQRYAYIYYVSMNTHMVFN